MTLDWKYESSDKNIKLFSHGYPFGHISSFSENGRGRLADKNFCFSQGGIFGQNMYFFDPDDDKAYCSFNSSDNSVSNSTFKYFIRSKIRFDRHKLLNKQIVLYSQKSNIESILNFDRLFFPKSGTIEILNTENMEVKIYALFFLNFYGQLPQ